MMEDELVLGREEYSFVQPVTDEVPKQEQQSLREKEMVKSEVVTM